MNFDDYENSKPYPSLPKKPRMNPNPTIEDAMKFVEELKEYDLGNQSKLYKYARMAYYEESERLKRQFFDDMAKDLGYVDNKKRQMFEDIVWELGHSAGYSEVYNYACDLVVLIR